VYRAKSYELPDAARDARGQHVANLLAFQPDEQIAEVLALRDYDVAPYLVLATTSGLVKKSRLTDFDSPRSGGIIAIDLQDGDEVISARLVSSEDDLLLVSRHAQAIRFHANDEALRPMGRATRGVIGMRFTDGDQLLGMYVVAEGADVLVATDGGYAKRTPSDQYPVQGRGGYGVLTARIVEARGELAGALMVHPDDEVFAITSAGGVIRTSAAEIKQSGRQTMGVRLVNLTGGTSLVAIARNAESLVNGEDLDADETDISPEDSVTPDGSGIASAGTTDAMTDSVSPDEEMADDDDESAGQGGQPADETDDDQ
jgi:DNA gyrase subunit A